MFDYPISEHWAGREGLAWLTGKEMGDMNLKKGAIKENLPHLSHRLPYSQAQSWVEANGKGTALKGQRPYQEKEKALVHSFCNTRPNRPYAAPLFSAALR